MMTIEPNSLFSAAEASQERLEGNAGIAARAKGTAERGAATAAMASESVFTEAMLSAIHARFAELKEATHV